MPTARDLNDLVDLGNRHATKLLVLLAAAAYVGLLVAARHGTFRQDEWAFIAFQPVGASSYLLPHNEHWSTIPRLVYTVLLQVVGLHSYVPYLAVLLALHVTAAGGAFVLLVRRIPPMAALIAAIPLLVLGSGYENLMWAFQIGFVGSVAAGTWALVLFEGPNRSRERSAGGAGLLLLALACSSMGLFFLLAAGILLLANQPLRRRVPWLALPVLAWLAWYMAIGGAAITGERAAPTSVLEFTVRGLSYAVGRFLGLDLAGRATMLGRLLGLVVLVLTAVGLASAVVRSRPPDGRTRPAEPATNAGLPALALAGFIGAVAMYAVIGLGRAEMADDFATRSRYVYVAAFLLVPAGADLIASLTYRRTVSPRLLMVGGAFACLSIGSNLVDARAGRAQFIEEAGLTRAKIGILAANQGASWLDSAGLPYDWAEFATIDRILATYGSPEEDRLLPSNVIPPRPDQVDRAILSLSLHGFVVTPASTPVQGRRAVPIVVEAHEAQIAPSEIPASSCLAVSAGSGGWLTVLVPGGSWLELARGAGSAPATAWLGHALAPTDRYTVALPADVRGPTRLATPDIGDGSSWQVRLVLPADAGEARLCIWSQ